MGIQLPTIFFILLTLLAHFVYRCDLAGSERLGKTMAEGVRLSEAKHINSSLLELGYLSSLLENVPI